jgi:antitoxin component of RelBE/YafQ-DinJ toxin-antitoxin module
MIMKTDRINIRVSPEIKGEIEKAAGRMGLSVSAYLIMLHKMQKNGVQLHGGGCGYEGNH